MVRKKKPISDMVDIFCYFCYRLFLRDLSDVVYLSISIFFYSLITNYRQRLIRIS